MDPKVTVIKTVDKEGREVFTYLKKAAPRKQTSTGRKKRNEAVRVTVKLPR